MKRELKQLAENAFGGWNKEPVYKSVSDIAWGNLSNYLMNGFIKISESLDIPFINTADSNGAAVNRSYGYKKARDNLIFKKHEGNLSAGELLKKEYNNSKKAENHQNGSYGSNRVLGGLKVFDSEEAGFVNSDIEIGLMGTALKQNMVSGMSESLASIVFNSVVANAVETTAADYGFYDRTSISGGQENFYGKNSSSYEQRIIDKTNNVSLHKNRFTAYVEYINDDVRNRTDNQRDDRNTIDIGYIEDKLACKLHEQLAAGFPMYLR